MKQFGLALFLFVFAGSVHAQTGQLVYGSFVSTSLNGMTVPVTTYLPPNYSATGNPYRLYIFLHGAGQNQNSFWSVLQPTLDQLINSNTIHPMIVLCPGLTGPVPGKEPLYYFQHLYRNSVRNGQFEDAVIVDLMGWLYDSSGYNVSSVRDKRAIGGFSDGGTGASYLGVRHNDTFVAFVSHHGSMALREYLDTTSTWLQTLLSESGGVPPYSYNPNNGIYSLIYFGNSSAFSPNMSNPPNYLDLPVDGLGNVISSVANGWLTENDPTTLILSPIYSHPIGMYFQSRPADWISYAFNTRFDQELSAHNIPHTFVTYPSGGHTFTVDAATNSLQWVDSIMNSPPLDIDETSAQMPTLFELRQNYPNPFNGQTTISFSIPRSTYATLKIFSTLGQKIATLVSKDLTPGTYSTEWNANNVASGIYFYRLQAGDFTQTRKLILLQ
jgi:S-formylglutathione hydrolase FrmB